MTSEAEEKFARWHERQFLLGACRCPECRKFHAETERLQRELNAYFAEQRAMREQAVAASAPEVSDVAVRASDEREAAPPAPPAGKLDGEDG